MFQLHTRFCVCADISRTSKNSGESKVLCMRIFVMYPRKSIKHELKEKKKKKQQHKTKRREKKKLYVFSLQKNPLGDVGTIKIRISRRQNLAVRNTVGGGRGMGNYHFLLLNSHIYGRIYII